MMDHPNIAQISMPAQRPQGDRYRELFRQEIAEIVADPAEVESELHYLVAALTRKNGSAFPPIPIGKHSGVSLDPT